MTRRRGPARWWLLLAAVGCGGAARLPVSAGTGPHPELPPPTGGLLPTVYVAPAKGWPAGRAPVAAEGTTVAAFAGGLEHPRWLYVLPNGDVLVAETSAPPQPEYSKGIRGWFMKRLMKQSGAAAPSADRITLLRDADGDGVAETRSVLLDATNGLRSPFGMALVDGALYVANTDAVVRFPYAPGQTRIAAPAQQVVALPAGPINQHWTRNLLASADGTRLYVAVGSASNVAEHGLEHEAVRDGGFYGWPYAYFGGHVDARVTPARPELVATAIAPDYALGPHTASLGLAAAGETTLPARFARGMFVAQHGSWNRKPMSGYKVIFVPFAGGAPAGAPLDVLTGFLDDHDGRAMGRPVGVALDGRGGLLVSDDVGDTVWRVAGGGPRS